MVSNRHFRRLEQIYTASPSPSHAGTVGVSYGRAQLHGSIQTETDGIVNRMPHQKLLSDAASLAAGSLEKEQAVTAEQFNANVADPDYRGPVVVTAQVVVAQPPRFVVQAVLHTPEGEPVAEATGVFTPSGEALPDDVATDVDAAEDVAGAPSASDAATQARPDAKAAPEPPAAAFPAVFPTPFGALNLN